MNLNTIIPFFTDLPSTLAYYGYVAIISMTILGLYIEITPEAIKKSDISEYIGYLIPVFALGIVELICWFIAVNTKGVLWGWLSPVLALATLALLAWQTYIVVSSLLNYFLEGMKNYAGKRVVILCWFTLVALVILAVLAGTSMWGFFNIAWIIAVVIALGLTLLPLRHRLPQRTMKLRDRGGLFMLTDAQTRKNLDSDGANVYTGDLNDNAFVNKHQLWKLIAIRGRRGLLYRLMHVQSGKVLGYNGTSFVMSTERSKSQLFKLEKLDGGYRKLYHYETGKYLDSNEDGHAYMEPRNDSLYQSWVIAQIF